ncbi:transglutaminase-like putative cysteine protease [Sedimentibacter acidaminivorans]|uniref:Transglutaminase-like putative cysteine protease n=1 Tax=Sedimentibacter acidaminivorans TaxID=913099 RepID=A0ABS4GH88_9FIRM|nr:transglutaminase-like domain-containing protein [Sedimentibacter acidaminivorans]MBP1927046.1 transglutaminase-like putative cysteine protease [Sedimentibacter acidaminivorans]
MYNDLEYLKVSLPEDILKLKSNGDFIGTIRLIDLKLKKEIPFALRKRLEIEKNIIKVIQREYPYSFEEALSIMQSNVKNFAKDELITLQEESAADWILVNGKVYFNESFYGNLLKTRPDIVKRLVDKDARLANEEREQLLIDNIKMMKEKGEVSYFIHLRTSLKIKKEYSRVNENIKVHLPLPIGYRQVKNINILKTQAKYISSHDYPQRTAFFEEKLRDDHEFSVEYTYENYLKYVNLDESKVNEIQPSFDTEEHAPHIMFTPYIKELAKELIGDETNPLIKARKIYDFITTKIMYSYMRKYFTITNIPEYAALNLKGDCGVQALLFITLCRYVGIPARWQSGLYVTPYYVGCHDWAEFYIEPYGWLFADPSFGGSAYRRGDKESWNFYFGNLDPFRMPAASEFQHEFDPPKKHLRYDPYDNQVGECEYDDYGLLREDFKVKLELIDMHQI